MKINYKVLLAGCLFVFFAGNLTVYADEPVLQPIQVEVPPMGETAAGQAAAQGSGIQGAPQAAETQAAQPSQNTTVLQMIPPAEQPQGQASVSAIPAAGQNTEASKAGLTGQETTAGQSRLTVEGGGESPYANVAVSQVSDYVNVRRKPNTDSEVVGKIYNNCAATIEEAVQGEQGTWYRIQSGAVTGYIKAEYFITGNEAEELAVSIGREFVTISTEGLRLREKPDLNSTILTHLSNGSRYLVQDSEGDFYKIEVDADLVGYVAKQYCKVTVEFDQAISLEEERQKQADENQRKQDAQNAFEALEHAIAQAGVSPSEALGLTGSQSSGNAGAAPENGLIEANPIPSGEQADTTAPSAGESTEKSNTISGGPGGTNSVLTGISSTVTSATRAAIVAYAKQFLGNPYVYGGTSLTNGTDCSGFVQGVFSHFGIKTGRSSRDQAANGKTISVTAAQPGDLLFYSSGNYINHVAIYIGNGQIIHAASARTGIRISNYDYRTPCKAVTFLE